MWINRHKRCPTRRYGKSRDGLRCSLLHCGDASRLQLNSRFDFGMFANGNSEPIGYSHTKNITHGVCEKMRVQKLSEGPQVDIRAEPSFFNTVFFYYYYFESSTLFFVPMKHQSPKPRLLHNSAVFSQLTMELAKMSENSHEMPCPHAHRTSDCLDIQVPCDWF